MKSCFLVLALSLQFLMFYSVIHFMFLQEPDLYTSMTWETPAKLRFPYVTICNPKMFDLKKAKEINVDAKFLSYLFATYSRYVGMKLKTNVNFIKEMNTTYYNINVNRTNLAIELAIKCEDFITSCGSTGGGCCGTVINPKPMISEMGICFSSYNATEVDAFAITGGMFFTLNVSNDYVANMDPSIVGDPALWSGASLGLHFNDHGLVAMKTREISLNRGTFNKIGISYFSVDRMEEFLKSDFNTGENKGHDLILKWFGYPAWSRANCEDFMTMQMYGNCSMMLTQGMNVPMLQSWVTETKPYKKVFNETYPPSELRVCHPDDQIRVMAEYFRNSSKLLGRISHFLEKMKSVCKEECYQEKISMDQSTKYLEKIEGSANTADKIYFYIFFSSLNKQVISVKTKDWSESLSQVGGMIGMIMGASFISMFELLAFYIGFFCLLFRLCKRKFQKW